MRKNITSLRGRIYLKPGIFLRFLSALAVGVFAAAPVFSQVQPITDSAIKLTSAEFVAQDGLTVERLVELGASRRADLLAARERLAIAEGRLQQARLRPNPTLDAEYGSPRFLGGESEREISIGVSQVFELGGKRPRRVAVAELELQQVRAEVLALERRLAAEIRAAYTNAVSTARQLDVLERLISANQEIVRVTEARLSEGDVAPLDANLVRVENDRLRVQAIGLRGDFDAQFLQIRTLIGVDIVEPIRLAPQSERPPRLDLGLNELVEIALKERADLQAARLGEQLGNARVNLARAQAVPNAAGSVRYSRGKEIFDFPPSTGLSPFPQTESRLTFGVSIEIPVFNRNQGAIAAATGETAQATRSREFLESVIRRDVAVAYRKYRAAAESLVLYSTQILPRAEANLQSVRAAYGLGDFSVFEVVGEQRRLTENVTDYNRILRDYYNALTELEIALGAPLPAESFEQSILPSEQDAPNRIDRAKFLKSIETVEMPKKNIPQSAELKKEP